jgi:hypothetical protein
LRILSVKLLLGVLPVAVHLTGRSIFGEHHKLIYTQICKSAPLDWVLFASM